MRRNRNNYYYRIGWKFTLFALLAAILLAALPGRAESVPSVRVINGSNADQGEYPFMVSIVNEGDDPVQDGIRCGGTLIDPKYVLTADHCVLPHASYQVIVGRTKLTEQGGVRVDVSQVLEYPALFTRRPTARADIAVLKLAEPVAQVTVPLLTQSELASFDPEGQGIVLGWGTTDHSQRIRPDNLQEGTVDVLQDSACVDSLGLDFDSEHMICAGKLASGKSVDDGVDTCFGDSGGPLLVESGGSLKQVGVTSWGFECTSHKFYGAYVKVPAVTEWLSLATHPSGQGMAALRDSGNRLYGLTHRELKRVSHLKAERLRMGVRQLQDLVLISGGGMFDLLPRVTQKKVDLLSKRVERIIRLRNPEKRRQLARLTRRMVGRLRVGFPL